MVTHKALADLMEAWAFAAPPPVPQRLNPRTKNGSGFVFVDQVADKVGVFDNSESVGVH